MRNQIAMARRLGIRAATIHSGNREEWEEVQRQLAADEIDVFLVSPERLGNEKFVTRVLPAIRRSIGLLVVDEAHCISDWGHDFRPDYRRIERILRSLPRGIPVLATTATANDRVVADVAEQLGAEVRIFRGPLARDSLRLEAIELKDQAERLAWLAEWVSRLPGSGIIYCLTVADTRRVAGWLSGRGIDARYYNAAMPTDEREPLEEALIDGSIKALVATVALGMGFDKPDLGFVIHYQRPGSAIAYYQQVGRAGRAVDRAYGILLAGREDDEIADYFIRTAFPPTIHMQKILEALAEVTSLSLWEFERRLNLPHGQIQQALKLLELDGAVAKAGGRYHRTPNPWQADEERIARVIASRRAELEQMRAYVNHPGCLMQYLTALLDDPDSRQCGQCSNDVGRGFGSNVNPVLVQEAIGFLRRDLRVIAPRVRWSAGAVEGLSGQIEPANEPGIALCVYGDPGWGRDVRDGKYADGRFNDALVEAAVRAVRDQWRPTPPPEWVTAIPSTSGRALVGVFAQAMADKLGLPYVECITTMVDAAPQKAMLNSVLQLRNAHAKLGIRKEAVLPGACLLIDDIVDSKWTLTVAGWLVRTHGSGPVHPFALAVAASRAE